MAVGSVSSRKHTVATAKLRSDPLKRLPRNPKCPLKRASIDWLPARPGGGIGIRNRLKIDGLQGHVGSNPTPGTSLQAPSG